MSDHLFDPAPFGGVKARRPHDVPKAEPVVKVAPPWVLLASTRHRPVAHLWTDTSRRNKWNGAIADCGAQGAVVSVEGEPLAVVCPQCKGTSR